MKFIKIDDREWAVTYGFLSSGLPALFHTKAACNIMMALTLRGIPSELMQTVKCVDSYDRYQSIRIRFRDDASEAEFIMNASAGKFDDI